MNPIQLQLSLSVVGPRERLHTRMKWPMALRVTAGYQDDYIDKEDAHALIDRSLPWNLWKGDFPQVLVIDDQGNRQLADVFAPQADTTAFLDTLKAEVEHKAKSLYEYMDFKVGTGGLREVVDNNQPSPVHLPWPGLLKTLTHLCAPTPSALKATWFFEIDASKLFEDDGTGTMKLRSTALLCAAPATFEGAAAAPGPFDAAAAARSFDYVDGMGARCNQLSANASLAHGLDELDNYWLSIRDSRDDSLLDLASRLEDALAPAALLGAIRIEEWDEVCRMPDAGGPRRCTAAELATGLAAWRHKDHLAPFGRELATLRKTVIEQTLAGGSEPAAFLRACYRETVQDLLTRIIVVAGTPKVHADDLFRLSGLLAQRLLPVYFEKAQPKPSRTGEGIQLLLGDERLRLASESHAIAPALDEVAAIQLFGRRSTDPAQLEPGAAFPAPWHALSAGHYAFGAGALGPDAAVARIFGNSAVYEDGVLYREVNYMGANTVCRNPLQAAHAEVLDDKTDSSAISLLLASPERVTSADWSLRALPLRYGDHYQFAASVMDRAGGQALELCEPGKPWLPRLGALADLDPPQRDDVHFLRRVAVGTCNLLPPDGGWPQTPDAVVLRCLEESAPLPPGERVASVCLVPRTAGFTSAAANRSMPWPDAIVFKIEPPKVDEHTALRWLMPATNAPREEQLAGRGRVAAMMKRMLQGRHEKLAGISLNEEPDHVPDPAVSAIGVRWQVGKDGPSDQFVLPAQTEAFRVDIAAATRHTGGSSFTVAPGAWLRIAIHPLVEVGDFARMDAPALGKLVTPDEWRVGGQVYRAFAEDLVFVECATDEVYQPRAEGLVLAANGAGDVAVRYRFSEDLAQLALLRHLDTMRLDSQRWKWRNMPIPPQTPGDLTQGSAEWRRRLASGPPAALMQAAQRDTADEVVGYFDKIAAMDTGFVGREPKKARVPRNVDDDAPLFTDGREGMAAADYLRYTWTVRSRYAGVLKNPERTTPDLRRIALPFRGDTTRIKPPRVLAVIPLLQHVPAATRVPDAADGTPFLVVFDEPWFREYGIGERVGAEIARVKREIGDKVDHPERRFGPLPDHSVSVTALPDALLQTPLDCFGPFGFTLDRTDDQAVANATGFVVYPPPGTPPHYNLFVKFQRLLDQPSGDPDPEASEFTEPVPLYTLPDSRELWPMSTPSLRLQAGAGPAGQNFTFDASTLQLRPFDGGHADLGKQYRYLLIVGRFGHDGGRALEVFLPSNALWLHEDQARALAAEEKPAHTHGVVVEILLSGRHAIGAATDPLAGVTNLRALFKHLLPGPQEEALAKKDALGMIRRFSPIGKIDFN